MAKTVSLTLPLARADLADLQVGDEVLLSGPVYTMRDAGHERALQCLEDTGRLPFDLEGATLFYAGPTPAAAGRPLGSVGPTTASRMDFATPRLFEAGIVAAIGKGKRSPEVVKSCQETGSVYPVSYTHLDVYKRQGAQGALQRAHLLLGHLDDLARGDAELGACLLYTSRCV